MIQLPATDWPQSGFTDLMIIIANQLPYGFDYRSHVTHPSFLVPTRPTEIVSFVLQGGLGPAWKHANPNPIPSRRFSEDGLFGLPPHLCATCSSHKWSTGQSGRHHPWRCLQIRRQLRQRWHHHSGEHPRTTGMSP